VPRQTAFALRIMGISYVYIDAFNRNARLTRALSRNYDLLVAGIGTSSRHKFSGVGGPLRRDARPICLTVGSLMFLS
jgi:hypothetical protein